MKKVMLMKKVYNYNIKPLKSYFLQDSYDSNRQSVNERLTEIDLNLVSDPSEDSSSSSPVQYLLENEQINVKLNNLKFKTQQLTNLNKNQQYNLNPNYNNESNQNLGNQEQLLDNSAIQHLVSEQTKSHLILDDKEILQCKTSAEFIALFRNKYQAQNNLTDESVNQEKNNQNLDLLNANKKNLNGLSPQLSPNSQLIEDKLVKCVSIFGK